MATTTVPAAQATAEDRMPVHGIDHVELYVGNAAQAAYFLTRAYGFTETAYAGLETGRRDRVSHVLESGPHPPGADRDAAWATTRSPPTTPATATACTRSRSSVPDAAAAYEHAVAHGARGRARPRTGSMDEHGRVQLSSVETYGDTLHLFVQRDDYEGPFLPGFVARDQAPAGPRRAAADGHRPHRRQRRARATWRSGSATTSASSG